MPGAAGSPACVGRRTVHSRYRDTGSVTTTAGEPEHLIVQQAVFAGAHFWAALNRLADRGGHEGHDRYLAGSSERTDQYVLQCVTCACPIAVMLIERDTSATAR